jgi:hypothetical protein
MHLLILIVLVPYFLPTIIAIVRKKRNTTAIVVLNLLLGWTVVGWIVALVWALTQDNPVVAVNVTSYSPPPATAGVQNTVQQPAFCQSCGTKLQYGARFCPSCGKAAA